MDVGRLDFSRFRGNPSVAWVIQRPIEFGNHSGQEMLDAFERVVNFLKVNVSRVALLIDGLDRMQDLVDFRRLVLPDLHILQELEIPVVCVVPLAVQFAAQPDLREKFDRVHELSSIRSSDGGLARVLQLRDTQALLSAEAGTELIKESGGLMRDLITLARDAAEEAYVSGSERIEKDHVIVAVREMGRSYSRGLSPRQIELLRSTTADKGFDPTDPEIMQLLASRRIIEYSSTSFAIHPALSKVLNLD